MEIFEEKLLYAIELHKNGDPIKDSGLTDKDLLEYIIHRFEVEEAIEKLANLDYLK